MSEPLREHVEGVLDWGATAHVDGRSYRPWEGSREEAAAAAVAPVSSWAL